MYSGAMADYSKWAEKHLSVASLLLDPQNPRIPPSEVERDQRALVEELIEHDDALDLAKDIADDGYSPVELLIAVVDDGKTYVLEGNRRLAALKVLLTPELAPASMLKKVKLLSQRADGTAISKVRVLIAPSRTAAAPLIMKRHTRDQIKGWKPVMQARFYRRLADEGMTAADLAAQYGGTPGEVAGFLRLDAAYTLACMMNLPDDVRTAVHNPRDFNASAFQRILDVPKARDRLGIEFDEDGRIAGKVAKDAFEKGFSRILSDIARGNKNTRSLNKAEDIENYIDEIKDDLPDKRQKGSFIPADFAKPTSGATLAKSPPPRKKVAQKPQRSKSVIPRGVKCELKSVRIKDIFNELRDLDVETKVNASAVLFRILLELCVGHYLDKTKLIQPLLDKAKKDRRPNDWYPPFRYLLDAILQDTTIDIHPLARKRLNKFVSDDKSPLSVDGLDSYVHNKFSPPSARDLRSYWETFEDLFKVILVEQPASPKSGAAK